MMRLSFLMLTVLLTATWALYPQPALAGESAVETWLPTLKTATPEEGFELAITLSRRGVTTTQSDLEVLHRERARYADDAEFLIAASQVIALHFQTIAAANNYWRDADD